MYLEIGQNRDLKQVTGRVGASNGAPREFVLRDILRSEGIVTRHERGEHLYRTGAPIDRVYLIQTGLVALSQVCRSGKRQVLDFSMDGSLLLTEGLTSSRSQHSAEILSDTVVHMLSASSFRRCIADAPGAQDALFDTVASSLTRARAYLTNIGCRQVQKRLCYLLYDLHSRLSETSDLASQGIPIRQVDLADAAGITTVYVNQILKKLEADNAIELNKGKIVILDPKYIKDNSGHR